MFRFARVLASLAVALLVVAGCSAGMERPGYPQISFAHLPPISLDVARVEVVDAYVSPATAPNVEHRFPVSPAATAENWGRDRLKPVGASGVVRVTVRRASVVEVPLERTKGLRGAFTVDQSERYEGVIEMAVEIFGNDGERRGMVEAQSKRTQTVPEDLSLNEREKIWFDMTDALMASMNKQLEEQIRAHLTSWVR